MANADRDAILARRALLISAALAGLACTPGEAPNEPEPAPMGASDSSTPPVVVETPGADPGQDRPSDGSRPAWAEVMAKAPPLDVPAGLSTSETQRLTYLAEAMRERYAKLAELWTTLPACGPSEAACEAWAATLAALDEVNPEDYGPLCGYSPEMTHAYLERERAHNRYLAQLSALLVDDLDAAVIARGNPADSEAWTALREAPELYGRPCLSCAMPTAEPIIDAVSFEEGAVTVTQAQIDAVLEGVRSRHEYNRQQQKATLIIRGHADAGEADPEGLARQRAEAVAGALVGLGVSRKQLEVRGYGAGLMISVDPGENRRVDFEVSLP